MGYLIECRMPGCEWRSRDPGDYMTTEAKVIQHLLADHTTRQLAEALVSSWQYGKDGHRQEQGDPLTFVPEHHEEKKEPPQLPPPEPKKKRRSFGRKARFAKTYAQMVLDAFDADPAAVLTTSAIKEYMGRVTGATIPVTSVCATLHKLCEDERVEHVATGQWKRHAEAL